MHGPARVACKVEGSIFIDTEDTLTIERSASVTGDINCHNLEIFGHVEGNVNATGKVVIYPSGQVNIALKSKSLVVHPGACVNLQGHAE